MFTRVSTGLRKHNSAMGDGFLSLGSMLPMRDAQLVKDVVIEYPVQECAAIPFITIFRLVTRLKDNETAIKID
jgi:hypothetical protein